MLFNSAVFLFAFLPLSLGLFWAFRIAGLPRLTIGSALGASLMFYGWDEPSRLLPLIGSILFNYLVGSALARRPDRLLLAFGIVCNLAVLGYFKYATFLTVTLQQLSGWSLPASNAQLPPGISFYTLTQLIFLIDAARKSATNYRLLEYSTFVTFYPHLVAGPILDHKSIMPQLLHVGEERGSLGLFCRGLSWFAAGLFKKVVFADGIAGLVSAPFAAASGGHHIMFGDAWIGALAYSLQLYFDFSGYSDMAIGLALMMGFSFPLNFNSPYQARSLAEFWRRWHMTLSQFLRDYLYIPAGGSRRGHLRTAVNIMLTMLIGGLWHGASWHFVAWGGLHGAGLLFARLAGAVAKSRNVPISDGLSWPATLLFVIFAWVMFRADSVQTALAIWSSMAGFHGLDGPTLATPMLASASIALLSAVALFMPNTQTLLGLGDGEPVPMLRHRVATWQPTTCWAIVTGTTLGIAVGAAPMLPTQFLYFQF